MQSTKQHIGGTSALDVYIEDGEDIVLYPDFGLVGWTPSHETHKGYRFTDAQEARTLAEALVTAATRLESATK